MKDILPTPSNPAIFLLFVLVISSLKSGPGVHKSDDTESFMTEWGNPGESNPGLAREYTHWDLQGPFIG